MVLVRVGLLAFWTFYAFSMGQISSGGLNAFGTLVATSFFIAAPALYLYPIYEAWRRQHLNLTAIALINVLLGWTFIGWLGALVWACSKSKDVQKVAEVYRPPAVADHPVKKCPFCAEDVRQEAVKCKHCGSELQPV